MIINKKIENLDQRMKSEFDYLQAKYKTVAFNMYDWWGKPNNRSTGKNILLATEGYITIPNNYNPDVIRTYDAFITYNDKFKALNTSLNIHLQNAPINWENYYWLEDFLTYDEKIKGICSLQRIYQTGSAGDINYMKDTVMKAFIVEPHLCLHTFGPAPFGKDGSYQGNLGYKHSHYFNLKKINEYLFCWCPEPIFHELWSYNYVTERLFNCFKSKTVAIYYGCYNIEEMIPKELYVDYRDFKNINELSQYLIELSKDKKRYTDMVEVAYQWNINTKLGDILLLEEILQECVSKYPI
jgi:ribosomal protein S18